MNIQSMDLVALYHRLVSQIPANALALIAVWSVTIIAVSLVASLSAATAILVLIPDDYFVSEKPSSWINGFPAPIGLLLRVLKNLVGAVLLLLGFVMVIPGIPGQGFLTIAVGFFLVDFPGKRKLERRLMKRPKIKAFASHVRSTFGRPPLK